MLTIAIIINIKFIILFIFFPRAFIWFMCYTLCKGVHSLSTQHNTWHWLSKESFCSFYLLNSFITFAIFSTASQKIGLFSPFPASSRRDPLYSPKYHCSFYIFLEVLNLLLLKLSYMLLSLSLFILLQFFKCFL